jgi:hypothetical protein
LSRIWSKEARTLPSLISTLAESQQPADIQQGILQRCAQRLSLFNSSFFKEEDVPTILELPLLILDGDGDRSLAGSLLLRIGGSGQGSVAAGEPFRLVLVGVRSGSGKGAACPCARRSGQKRAPHLPSVPPPAYSAWIGGNRPRSMAATMAAERESTCNLV